MRLVAWRRHHGRRRDPTRGFGRWAQRQGRGARASVGTRAVPSCRERGDEEQPGKTRRRARCGPRAILAGRGRRHGSAPFTSARACRRLGLGEQRGQLVDQGRQALGRSWWWIAVGASAHRGSRSCRSDDVRGFTASSVPGRARAAVAAGIWRASGVMRPRSGASLAQGRSRLGLVSAPEWVPVGTTRIEGREGLLGRRPCRAATCCDWGEHAHGRRQLLPGRALDAACRPSCASACPSYPSAPTAGGLRARRGTCLETDQ